MEVVSTKIPFAVACKAISTGESRMANRLGMSCQKGFHHQRMINQFLGLPYLQTNPY